MQLVVPMSESSISKVRVGQPAEVMVDALPNEQLAAHVTSISLLPTSSSGVVSYDVTLVLDQLEAGLRDGMSASASIIVSQAQGISVPSGAITTRNGVSTVTVVRNGQQVSQPVITGVVGDSTTQIVSGLSAGEQVAIPIVSATSSSAMSATAASSATGSGGGGGRFGGGALGGLRGLGG